MPLLPVNSPGQYLCKITDHGVDEGPDNMVSIQLEVMITHEWNENQWQDISRSGYTVNSFVNLRNGDKSQYNPGAWNSKTLNTIAELFDWYDGKLETLQSMDTTIKMAMVTIENNKENSYSRIKYIDLPRETPGGNGVKKAEPKKVQEMSSKYGSQLRGLIKKPAAPRPEFVLPGMSGSTVSPNGQAPWEGDTAEDLGGL